jgi:hypothetical protein
VKTQVEYYLSDKNLEKDAFFYGKILENENGYLDLDLIMNCNKIKSLGVSKERIVEACKTSSEVDISADGNQIRRKGNKSLPESKFKSKKLAVQLKSEKSVSSIGVAKSEVLGESKADEEVEDSKEFIPLILFIKDTSRLDKVIGREFEAKLGEELKIEVPFARIGKYDGNVVFNRAEITQEILERLISKGFEYEGQKVVFEVGTDRDRDEFMRNHGRHVGKIILKSNPSITEEYKKEMGKPIKEQKKKFRGKVEFLGVNYPTVESLKAVFKALIVKTKNDATIEEPGRSQVAVRLPQLLELLKHHEHSEEKLKGAKDFTVALHPEFKQTRCFFIVKEDGTKEDFSFHKCLTRMIGEPVEE